MLDRASVRSVDRAAIEEYGIPGIVLMENAARALSRAALQMLEEAQTTGRVVLIVCGRGNNGGDGWALARHLHNAGARPVVLRLGEPRPGTDAATNCAICRKMGVEEITAEERGDFEDATDLIVDAIFGTGLDRPVEGAADEMIRWINGTGRPVLAVDTPSGLDCDTGQPLGQCVQATRTITFVGLKPGFQERHAQPFVGAVTIGDIGVPRALVARLGTVVEPDPPAAR